MLIFFYVTNALYVNIWVVDTI